MADRFQNQAPTLNSPASKGFDVTPADSVLANSTRGIYVGGTGDVKVTTVEGDTFTFKAVPVGAVLPVRAKQIWATGTTATLMVGLY